MADLTVILNQNVPYLGTIGDVVSVAPGYGRNYLIPRGLAIPATSRNVRELSHQKRVIEVKRAKAIKTAEALAKRLGDVSITMARAAGEEDRLFGSVTSRDVEEALQKEGYTIDRRSIAMEGPIKSLGVHKVAVKLHGDIRAEIKVWVVAE